MINSGFWKRANIPQRIEKTRLPKPFFLLPVRQSQQRVLSSWKGNVFTGAHDEKQCGFSPRTMSGIVLNHSARWMLIFFLLQQHPGDTAGRKSRPPKKINISFNQFLKWKLKMKWKKQQQVPPQQLDSVKQQLVFRNNNLFSAKNIPPIAKNFILTLYF